MAEYQADELVSGSDDERKLEKAERAARKFWKKKKAAKPGNKASILRFRQPYSQPYQMAPWAKPVGMQPGQQVPTRGQMPIPRPQVAVRPCFACGEMGHLKRFCPKPAPGTARWYPCDDETRELSKRRTKGSVNSANRAQF